MRFTALATLALAVGLLASLLVPRAAQAEEGDGRPDASRQRIQFLVREARALEAEGRAETARKFLARAEELERRALEKENLSHAPVLPPEEARTVLRGLRAGIAALGRIHRPREQEALERVAREFLARMRAAGRGERKATVGRRREAAAKKRFRALHLAAEAFREAKDTEAVERMELAMHALKLRLEGRRDEEAREIYDAAPQGEETRKLLRRASRLWAGKGHEKKAEALGALAGGGSGKTAGDHAAARRKAKANAKRKAKANAKRKAPRPAEAGETAERLKRLGAQIERLAHGLKTIRHELDALREAASR